MGRAWALGQKGKDNGAILLVSKTDRKMRIEVGYGLEPVLTDLQTSIIQNQVIIPHFKQGDFGGGIEAGVDAILSTIQGKAVQPAPEAQPTGSGGPFQFLAWIPPLRALRAGPLHPQRHPQRQLDRLHRRAADPLLPRLARPA